MPLTQLARHGDATRNGYANDNATSNTWPASDLLVVRRATDTCTRLYVPGHHPLHHFSTGKTGQSCWAEIYDRPQGEFALGLALGSILLVVAFVANVTLYYLQGRAL